MDLPFRELPWIRCEHVDIDDQVYFKYTSFREFWYYKGWTSPVDDPYYDGGPVEPGPTTGERRIFVRHEWAEPYDYLGTADLNTEESAPDWVIRRITISPDGDALTETAIGVAWDDRATETYT